MGDPLLRMHARSLSHAPGDPIVVARQRIPLNIPKAVRVRLRIMDSKETRGTSIILRSSAPRSKRCAALGMCAAARSNAPEEAVRMPEIAR